MGIRVLTVLLIFAMFQMECMQLLTRVPARYLLAPARRVPARYPLAPARQASGHPLADAN